jgi:hypothetical protein
LFYASVVQFGGAPGAFFDIREQVNFIRIKFTAWPTM